MIDDDDYTEDPGQWKAAVVFLAITAFVIGFLIGMVIGAA